MFTLTGGGSGTASSGGRTGRRGTSAARRAPSPLPANGPPRTCPPQVPLCNERQSLAGSPAHAVCSAVPTAQRPTSDLLPAAAAAGLAAVSYSPNQCAWRCRLCSRGIDVMALDGALPLQVACTAAPGQLGMRQAPFARRQYSPQILTMKHPTPVQAAWMAALEQLGTRPAPLPAQRIRGGSDRLARSR